MVFQDCLQVIHKKRASGCERAHSTSKAFILVIHKKRASGCERASGMDQIGVFRVYTCEHTALVEHFYKGL